MKISVVGTGYVGLVVAACFAENGNNVIAVDIIPEKIDKLRKGEIPIYEPGLEEIVKRNLDEERLSFTTDLKSAIETTNIIFIAVGTPPDEDGSADMSHVLKVADAIGRFMNGQKIVVLKSTVPVGTNRRVRETIAALTDHPFGVVSNPEFLKEGTAIDDFLRPDRVVIGVDSAEFGDVMCELYRPFVRTGNPIMVMDPSSAELTKYASNAMLATRISFMNEMARICEKVGADITQIRKAVGTDRRIGHAFLFAGVGYGGSCFPKDVRALVQTAKELGVDLPLVRATEEVNNAQKLVLFPKIKSFFAGDLNGVTLAVWGLAFKPKTDDMREAPAVSLISAVVKGGGRVRVYDPEAMKEARRVLPEYNEHIVYCQRGYEACEGADGLVLMTEWNEFRNPDFERIRSLLSKPVIFDGRNIYNHQLLKELGFDYFGVGKG